MRLEYTDTQPKEFIPTGDFAKEIEPLHFLYPDSEGRVEPTFIEGFKANLKYQWLPITNSTMEYFNFAATPYDESFDWLKEIQDNEDYFYADELSRAKNKQHYQYIKNDLMAMQANREVFQRSGLGATLVAGVVDPLNIAFFHPVFNTGIKAAWAAKSAFGVAKESGKIGFLFGMGSEALRAPFDPFNTYAESVVNVAGNTVFAGLLGGGARGVTNKFNKIVANHKAKNNPDPTINNNNFLAKETIIEGLSKGGRFPDYVFHRTNRNKDLNKQGLKQGIAQSDVPPQDASMGDIIYVFRKQDFPIENFSGDVSKIKDYVPAKPVTAFHISELDPKGVTRNPNDIGKIKTKQPNIKDVKNLDDFIVNGKNTLKNIGQTERLLNRINAEQETRLKLLNNKDEMQKKASETGETLANITKLVTNNYNQNKITQDKLNKIIKSSTFKEFKAATEQRASQIKFKNINPNEMDAPVETKFVTDEEIIKLLEADFRINQKFDVPLDKDPVMKGSSLKELTIDKLSFLNKLIPSRRLQFGKYDGQEAPSIVKDYNMQIAFNGAVSMQGRPVQSIDVMQQVYNAKGLEVEQYIDNLYMQELYKVQGTGQIAGIDYLTPFQKAQQKLGKQIETKYFNDATRDYLKKIPSKQEFREEIVELQILNGNPAWNKSYFADIPEYKRKGMERIAQFYRYFDELAQDVGVFHTPASVKAALVKLDDRITLLGEKIKKEKDPAAKEIYKLSLKNLLKQKNFYDGYQQTRDNYKWAIYYDKQMLLNDPAKQKQLENIFADHYLDQGFITRWTGNSNERLPITSLEDAQRAGAEDVSHILSMGDDPMGYSTPLGVGKGKHIMMRTTNIPEWKVKDFIVKDLGVLSQYAKNMGFRIEYARKFGDDSIDYIMDMMEAEMQTSKKYTQRAIANIKSDFLSDYERVAGQMTREPNRWDTKFARIGKKFSGVTYLTGAGITAVTETVAMPVLEHGLGNVIKGVFRSLDGNFDKMRLNAKQVQHVGEGLEMYRPIAQDKYLGEMTRPLQMGKIEKGAEAMENLFYKFNFLSFVTSLGKGIDSSIRIPKFYNQIKNYDNLDQFDIDELNRYGITRDLAKRLYENGAWQFTDSDMPLLNIQGWSTKTKADRELKSQMETYLNNGARNTIMHATAFDRPTMADGFVFKKWKPYMAKMGIQPDPRASVGKQADGSYRYPIARIESGVMSYPFQFYNFSFAANQRILRPMFDPNKKHRLSGAIALMGMSYLVLSTRKPDWWFEDKDYSELFMQVVDRSGILGLYSEIAYRGIEASAAFGLHNPDNSWLKGRYNATGWDAAFGMLGATPNMYREWINGAYDLVNDRTEEGLKTISYNAPLLGLLGLDDDLRSIAGGRNR